VEYQRIAAACLSLVFSTDGSPFGGLVLERCGWGMRGLVFGTLLGPEATGPGRVAVFGRVFPGLVCFWFPGCTDRMVDLLLWGLCVGCVVRGCCLRTT
jgi:hypothetical protein